MDTRRHKINPGRIPGQPGRTPKRSRRPSGSHEYLHGWSAGWSDARTGKTSMPKQRGGGGGKTPSGKKPSPFPCLFWVAAPPAVLTAAAALADRLPL